MTLSPSESASRFDVFGFERRPDRIERSVDDRDEIDWSKMKLKFSGDDARYVENVFNDLFLRPRVSFNHFDRVNWSFHCRDVRLSGFATNRSQRSRACAVRVRVWRETHLSGGLLFQHRRALRSRTRSWANFLFGLLARGDVALDADVTLRLA
jgi:hypothetical protein